MPTTSNFGWTTPADTDLVKDGALAIRTLGNGIDTSLIDLKGGTTGQVLSKATNTDLDYTWITPNVGDITEVQAGVGISVASGTGPIPVITNSSTDLITTAGDLLYGTAADTMARLGIGTAGQVLKVNSGATAPEWGAAGAASFVGVSAYTTSLQTVSNNTWTAINFNNEFFDTNGFHDNSVNNTRLTIPSGKGGYYFIGATVGWNDSSSGEREHKIYLNGAAYSPIRAYTSVWNAGAGRETVAYLATILSLSAGDYIELYGRQTSGGNLSATTVSNFSIGLLGA